MSRFSMMRKRLKNIYCNLKSRNGKLSICRWKTREGKPYSGPDVVMGNLDAVEAYWVQQTKKDSHADQEKER